jgi:hypothetical protein
MKRTIPAFALAALCALPALAQEPEAPAPVIVKLSSLPPVLDHKASFDDAKPDEQGVRRSVRMGGLDKITARTFEFEAPVGTTVRFNKLLITTRMCRVRPPEETPETTVFVEIAEATPEGGDNLQRLFSGWMFASSPGLNALEHPVYDVWVIGCQIDDPSNPEASTSIASQDGETQTDLPSIDDEIEQDDAARE